MRRRVHVLVLASMAAALLAACGGGGDGGGDAVTALDSGAAAPASAYDCGLANFQAELLQRVNALRAAGASCGTKGSFGATTALAWNATLTQAALGHSTDMATQDYFSHTSNDGTTMGQRVTNAGYAWSLVAENIAAGYTSVQAVMDGWIASDGHCANLMNPGLREIGVACVPRVGSATYSHYWTMDLAAPR